MSLPRPPLTTQRRLGPGKVLRAGSTAPYRAVTVVDGEPHIVRDDFGVAGAGPEGDSAAGTAPAAAAAGRPLLCLVHLTDVQLADVQSPTRFEFLNRYFADPGTPRSSRSSARRRRSPRTRSMPCCARSTRCAAPPPGRRCGWR